MFAISAVAACLAALSSLSLSQARPIPHSVRLYRRAEATYPNLRQPPAQWAFEQLEPYIQYHYRYLTINCPSQHNTSFFDTCCHPRYAGTADSDYQYQCSLSAHADTKLAKELVGNPKAAAEAASAASSLRVVQIASASSVSAASASSVSPVSTSKVSPVATATSVSLSSLAKQTATAGTASEKSASLASSRSEAAAVASSSAASVAAGVAASASKLAASKSSAASDYWASESSIWSAAAASKSASLKSKQGHTPSPTSTSASTAPTSSRSDSTSSSSAPTSTSSDSGSGSGSNSGSGSSLVNWVTGGIATFFSQNGVAGACGQVHTDSFYLVAERYDRYGNGQDCGRKVEVVNQVNGKSVVAVVADECMGCQNGDSLDLSLGAFAAIGDYVTGEYDIKWRFLD